MVVGSVDEPVGDASEDLELVVGALEATFRNPPGGRLVEGEDLVRPGQEGVDDGTELGDLAGGVEIGESVEGFEGAVAVVGGVEPVELLEGLPHHPDAGVAVEQVDQPSVGLALGAAEQSEAGSEQIGIEREPDLATGFAALSVAAHEREPGREPAGDMEPVRTWVGPARWVSMAAL